MTQPEVFEFNLEEDGIEILNSHAFGCNYDGDKMEVIYEIDSKDDYRILKCQCHADIIYALVDPVDLILAMGDESEEGIAFVTERFLDYTHS